MGGLYQLEQEGGWARWRTNYLIFIGEISPLP